MPNLGVQAGIWIRSDNGFSHDPIPHPYRFQTPAALVANHIFAAISDATHQQNQLLCRLKQYWRHVQDAMPDVRSSQRILLCFSKGSQHRLSYRRNLRCVFSRPIARATRSHTTNRRYVRFEQIDQPNLCGTRGQFQIRVHGFAYGSNCFAKLPPNRR